MKIVIAPDSYKGAMRAEKVADTLAKGWLHVRPDDEVVCIPLSDGGEGMAGSLAAACGGEFLEIPTWDALMRPVTGKAVLLKDAAVLESAEANGIERIARDDLNPMMATTYGVGVMISALLDRGFRELIIGIGGSATVDGGAGMLQALGAVLYDSLGNELPRGAGGGVLRHVTHLLHDLLGHLVLSVQRSQMKAMHTAQEQGHRQEADRQQDACGRNPAAGLF